MSAKIVLLHNLTRSGHVTEPTKPDCRDGDNAASTENPDAPEQEEERSSSSESSASSDSSSSSSDDEAPVHWSTLGASDPYTQHG